MKSWEIHQGASGGVLQAKASTSQEMVLGRDYQVEERKAVSKVRSSGMPGDGAEVAKSTSSFRDTAHDAGWARLRHELQR